MKHHLLLLLKVFVCILISGNAIAQTFDVTYNFANVTSSTGGRTDPTAPPTATNVSFGAFTAVAPSGNPHSLGANPNAGGRFSFQGWPTGATNGSDVFTGSLDAGQYYQVTITPATGYLLTLTNVTFILQRSGTGIRQYVVRASVDNYSNNLPASISPSNANLSVVSGNIFQVTDAVTTAQTGSNISMGAGFTDVNGAITLRFYGFNAEASGGTFSLDDVRIQGSVQAGGATPAITLNPTSLTFPSTAINTTSAPQTYTLSGTNLTNPVNLTTTAPFAISKDNTTYSTSASYTVAELASSQTVYVQYSPTATGPSTGSIQHTSTGAATQNLALSGQAFDPSILAFDFNTCTNLGAPGSGFTTFSVTGAQVWTCTSFGRNSTNGVNMNGFSSGAVENEDWLISPVLNLSSFNVPILSFYSRAEFAGPALDVLISTNYSGTGNPNSATWTILPVTLSPDGSNTWTLSDNTLLLDYKTSGVYIAWRYRSSPEDGAARWTLDDIEIRNASQGLSTSPASINFGEVPANTSSAPQSITAVGVGYGDVTFTTAAPFELSSDGGTTYGPSVTFTEAQIQAGTSFLARISPTSQQLTITGQIQATGTALNETRVTMQATSLPKAQTLDIVTYNLEFFGANVAGFGPADKALQRQNVATVITRMNPDVIAVQEVSDETDLAQMVSTLPGYAYVLSPRWSYSFDPPDPAFPEQKIGFIYKTSVVSYLDGRPLFDKMYDSARTGLSSRLSDYPTGNPSSFWSSGRLPFMGNFQATIDGVTKQFRLVVLHAKSGAAIADWNRRSYDNRVLKDTLDAMYGTDPVMVLGDYNDRLASSITTSQPSSYQVFLNDAVRYNGITQPNDAAGQTSFLGSGGSMIDHIIISNEWFSEYLTGSAEPVDARSFVSNYANTTSDHLPVQARFQLSTPVVLPAQLLSFNARALQQKVQLDWLVAQEQNVRYYVVERSANGRQFSAIDQISAQGTANGSRLYTAFDGTPMQGANYYRLRMVDADGSFKYSQVELVQFVPEVLTSVLSLRPNPYNGQPLQLSLPGAGNSLQLRLVAADGRPVLQATGSLAQLNAVLAQQAASLTHGLYLVQVTDGKQLHTAKYIK